MDVHIVVHNGVSPTRFFLYLFPEEPHFNEEEVGEPAFLTPLLEAGNVEEARKRFEVTAEMWLWGFKRTRVSLKWMYCKEGLIKADPDTLSLVMSFIRNPIKYPLIRVK